MYKYKSEFLKFIDERGFLNQISDSENLDKIFMNKGVSAYIGFDCFQTTSKQDFDHQNFPTPVNLIKKNREDFFEIGNSYRHLK